VAHATIPARPRPRQEADTSPYFHTLVAGETIEQLAWRYLGSSDAWWQIADANPTQFPTAFEPGAVVAVPTSASTGQVERTRPF
jgi:nucleoid-associated protein YgaU